MQTKSLDPIVLAISSVRDGCMLSSVVSKAFGSPGVLTFRVQDSWRSMVSFADVVHVFWWGCPRKVGDATALGPAADRRPGVGFAGVIWGATLAQAAVRGGCARIVCGQKQPAILCRHGSPINNLPGQLTGNHN